MKSQIIYIEIDEEVISVYDRIKNIKKDTLYLVVPRKAILFQSIVNLKILKSKLSALGKKLIIVTTDRKGAHLAERVGIKTVRRVEVEATALPDIEDSRMKIQPIVARRNVEIMREERPTRFKSKKISIRELIQDFRKKNMLYSKEDEERASSFHLARPSRKLLALILIISVGLFGIISYIALPAATIYISPKFGNIDFTVNILLADKRKNQTLLDMNEEHVVASEIVNTETKQTKIFKTASKEFNGENAKGTIKIINTTNEPWPLKEDTRFQTGDGLVFRIKKGVEAPARSRDESGELVPGVMTAVIEADPFDIYDEPIGSRGNIGPSKLIIPGLSKYNQRLIWGETEKPMTGGITDYRKIVKKEDIDAAMKQVEDNLIAMAKEELRIYIDEINKLNKTNLVLLDNERYLKTELADLRKSDDLLGSYRDKFEIFAKIRAEGMAFDFDQLFAILKKELSARTHPDMRLRESSVSPENITYEVIEEDPLLGRIKITASVKGIEEYVIDSSNEAGLRFGTRLKEKIQGLEKEEAEKLIANFPEVDKVEIKTWPIWLSKLPRIPEKIEIKLMEGN